jgi:hypothetical protein
MNNNIYDLSRFNIVNAVERLNILCYNYNLMLKDSNLNEEDIKLKEELSEAIPLLKADICARINEL